MPPIAAGTAYKVVAPIAALWVTRSTVAYSAGIPWETVATAPYLMIVLNDRFPVVSEAAPVPMASEAAPRRVIPASLVAVDAVLLPNANTPSLLNLKVTATKEAH